MKMIAAFYYFGSNVRESNMFSNIDIQATLNIEPPAMRFDSLEQAREFVAPQIKTPCSAGKIEQAVRFMFRKYGNK